MAHRCHTWCSCSLQGILCTLLLHRVEPTSLESIVKEQLLHSLQHNFRPESALANWIQEDSSVLESMGLCLLH